MLTESPARRLAAALIRRGASRVGLDVVQAEPYSPIPHVPAPNHKVWGREYPVQADTAGGASWLRRSGSS